MGKCFCFLGIFCVAFVKSSQQKNFHTLQPFGNFMWHMWKTSRERGMAYSGAALEEWLEALSILQSNQGRSPNVTAECLGLLNILERTRQSMPTPSPGVPHPQKNLLSTAYDCAALPHSGGTNTQARRQTPSCSRSCLLRSCGKPLLRRRQGRWR